MAVRLEWVGCHLDTVCAVRADDVIEDLEVGPGRVDAMLLVAFLIVSFEAVVSNHVPLDSDMMPVAEDSLVGVFMDRITLQDDVMGVVELDPIPAVPDFKNRRKKWPLLEL
jgi:hypothetical protein